MKISKNTKHDILEILKNPEAYVNQYFDIEVVTLNKDKDFEEGPLRILLGVDENGKYYIVEEDDIMSNDEYQKDNESLIETFIRILDKNIK